MFLQKIPVFSNIMCVFGVKAWRYGTGCIFAHLRKYIIY